MTVPLMCVLGAVVWTALLAASVVGVRGWLVLRGEAIDAFPAEVPHGGPRYRRLLRAHLNATENLPIFAAVCLVGDGAGVFHEVLDVSAVVWVAARVVQTTIHIASPSPAAVALRATAFSVQVLAVLTHAVAIVALYLGRP